MYIEFSLPSGAAGLAASHALGFIRSALHEWSDKYDISYTSQLDKYSYRIQFDKDETYSFFVLTWNPSRKTHSASLKRIRIVDADLPNNL
jgi:hypothetical protein